MFKEEEHKCNLYIEKWMVGFSCFKVSIIYLIGNMNNLFLLSLIEKILKKKKEKNRKKRRKRREEKKKVHVEIMKK